MKVRNLLQDERKPVRFGTWDNKEVTTFLGFVRNFTWVVAVILTDRRSHGAIIVSLLLLLTCMIFVLFFAKLEELNKHLLITAKPIVYLINLSIKDYTRKKNKWWALMFLTLFSPSNVA